MVQYEGSGLTDKHWFLADQERSVIASADSTGTPTIVNTYDEYGVGGLNNLGRFQYTGQAYVAEVQLYYYKARFYSPTLGRFMQTDAAGYGDGSNLYEYVHGDPINNVDPTGLATCGPSLTDDQCRAAMEAQEEALKELRAKMEALKELRHERKEMEDGKRTTLSKQSSDLKEDIISHFGNDKDSTLNKVSDTFRGAESALADTSGKWKIEFDAKAASDELGHNNIGSHTVYITNLFMSQPAERVPTMVHEFSHPFLLRVWEAYHDKDMYGIARFVPWYAQNNAESYSHFVTGRH